MNGPTMKQQTCDACGEPVYKLYPLSYGDPDPIKGEQATAMVGDCCAEQQSATCDGLR